MSNVWLSATITTTKCQTTNLKPNIKNSQGETTYGFRASRSQDLTKIPGKPILLGHIYTLQLSNLGCEVIFTLCSYRIWAAKLYFFNILCSTADNVLGVGDYILNFANNE